MLSRLNCNFFFFFFFFFLKNSLLSLFGAVMNTIIHKSESDSVLCIKTSWWEVFLKCIQNSEWFAINNYSRYFEVPTITISCIFIIMIYCITEYRHMSSRGETVQLTHGSVFITCFRVTVSVRYVLCLGKTYTVN